MALNAYARAVTDRVVDPLARVLVRLGMTANRLTLLGVAVTLAGVGVLLSGPLRLGVVIVALGSVVDALDGAVARLQGTDGALGAFYDSVTDRVGDVALLGAAAWMVRDDPLLFGVAVVALGGAQLTSYVRAKAESLGWQATVGVLERAERVIILLVGLFLGFLEIVLWVLAVGSLVTVGQRFRAVLDQARPTGSA